MLKESVCNVFLKYKFAINVTKDVRTLINPPRELIFCREGKATLIIDVLLLR